MIKHTTEIVEEYKQMFEEFWIFLPRILKNTLEKTQEGIDNYGKNLLEPSLDETELNFKDSLLYKNGWHFQKDFESEILLFRRLANNYSKLFTKLFDVQRTNLHHAFKESKLIEKYMSTISNQPFIFIVVSVHKLMLSISFCRMVSQIGNSEHEKLARVSATENLKIHINGFREIHDSLGLSNKTPESQEIKETLSDFLFADGSTVFELSCFKDCKNPQTLTKIIRLLDHYFAALNLMEFLKSSYSFSKNVFNEAFYLELGGMFENITFCEITIQRLRNNWMQKNLMNAFTDEKNILNEHLKTKRMSYNEYYKEIMGVNEQATVESNWKILEILNSKTKGGYDLILKYIGQCSKCLFEASADNELSKDDYCRMLERSRLLSIFSGSLAKIKGPNFLHKLYENNIYSYIKESVIDAMEVIARNNDKLRHMRERAIILTDDQILKDFKEEDKRDFELTLDEAKTKFIFESIVPNIFMISEGFFGISFKNLKTTSLAFLTTEEHCQIKKQYQKAKLGIYKDIVEILGKLTVDMTSWNKRVIYPIEKNKAKLKLSCWKDKIDVVMKPTQVSGNEMDIEVDNSLYDSMIVTLDRNWDLGRALINSLDLFFGSVLQNAKKFGPIQPMKKTSNAENEQQEPPTQNNNQVVPQTEDVNPATIAQQRVVEDLNNMLNSNPVTLFNNQLDQIANNTILELFGESALNNPLHLMTKAVETELEKGSIELFNKTADIIIGNTEAFMPFLKVAAEFFSQFMHKADSCGSSSKKLVLKYASTFFKTIENLKGELIANFTLDEEKLKTQKKKSGTNFEPKDCPKPFFKESAIKNLENGNFEIFTQLNLNMIVLINIINFGISKNINIVWAKELNLIVEFYEQFAQSSSRLAAIYDKIGKETYQNNAHHVRFFVNNLTRLIKMIIFGIEKQDYMTSTADKVNEELNEKNKKPVNIVEPPNLINTPAVKEIFNENKIPEKEGDNCKDKQNQKPAQAKTKNLSEIVGLELRKRMILGATILCNANKNFNKYECTLFDVPMVTRTLELICMIFTLESDDDMLKEIINLLFDQGGLQLFLSLRLTGLQSNSTADVHALRAMKA